MTFFKKYFNRVFIVLCIYGLFSGKFNAIVWLILFSAGTLVFLYFAILFLKERNFFEQYLTAEEMTKFKQLSPFTWQYRIKHACSDDLFEIENERNTKLFQISVLHAERLTNSEKIISRLNWIFMIWFILVFNIVIDKIR